MSGHSLPGRRPLLSGVAVGALLCLAAAARSQVTINYNDSGVPTSATLSIVQGYDDCGSLSEQGADNNLNVDLTIDFLAAAKQGYNAYKGKPVDVTSFLSGAVTCSSTVADIRGGISAYVLNLDPNVTVDKQVRGSASYQDTIQILVPMAMTVEIPYSVGASLVGAQSFTDTSDSYALAGATITGSVGGTSIAAGDQVKTVEIVDQKSVNASGTAVVSLSAGLNTITADVTASLYVESRVKGLGFLIAGASNAGATNASISIGNFTGPGGVALPPHVLVRGMTSGIVYANTSPASVSGTVGLGGAPTEGQSLDFEFRPDDGGPPYRRTAVLDAGGAFMFSDLPPLKYVVWVKGAKWLAATAVADVSQQDVSGLAFSLRPGDINNDNTINILDLGLLADAFGSIASSAKWNPDADLNGDGKVDILDLGLLADSFGKSGAP
jgi:hypothetical protein